ncbi:uncharacterized protein LTR77_001800 [Saxophila tyrrhenica]|uniref:Non-structural maintenance of chromosomes element 4 n=1 Tax=Saxophila tyrrhenica TaxID=1690608 RepID=A0AAV9PLG3_9PEZI|nr:hypothetical protein LTR77_001800 [Saxophila tyrrhenica]
MARLNNRPSNAPSSRYNSTTPAPSGTSDQENRDPSMRPGDKGKGRASDAPRPQQRSNLPTPQSEGSSGAQGQKRKRGSLNAAPTHDEDDEDTDEREERQFKKYFDPNQDPHVRRDVKRKSRALERDFQERRDDLLRDSGDGLTTTVRAANKIYKEVKQTNDATLDSRLLVNVSDLANKKTAQLVLGDNSTGVDVDEFLSKCITFMRNGGPLERDEEDATAAPRNNRRRRTRSRDDSDDEEDIDDIVGQALDWDVLGRRACFPSNARPCVPSFLLGPLSVEKKQRTQTQRRARQSKDTSGREARPENLTREDLSQTDANGLQAICTRIRSHLEQHVRAGEKTLQDNGITSLADLESSHGKQLLRRARLADNGAVSLFDYVLNPRSFGQTVENLFYVSFLIKEGSIGVTADSQGLPTLEVAQPSTLEEQRRNKSSKHQAVLALDYGVWQQLTEAFGAGEPLIPHREEGQTQGVGTRGWYT